MALEASDIEGIGKVVKQVLENHIPQEVHLAQHAWLTDEIERRKKKAEAIEAIKHHLIEWGIKGMVASFVAMVIYAMTHGFWNGGHQ